MVEAHTIFKNLGQSLDGWTVEKNISLLSDLEGIKLNMNFIGLDLDAKYV